MTVNKKTFKITFIAILSALTIVIAFLPIKTFGLEITLTIIPITVGAVLGGKYVGLILGTVFGFTSFIQCFGYSIFGASLLAINPFYTFLVCVPTRMLAGFLTGLIKEGFDLYNHPKIGTIIACVIMPILNTLLFTSVLIICFYNTTFIQDIAKDIVYNIFNNLNPLNFAICFVGINGLVEILVGIFISIPLVKTLEVNFKHKIRN